MKHRYCPSCGSLDMKRLINGAEECLRCRFKGEFREGSMDEINSFRKGLKSSGTAVSAPSKGREAGIGPATGTQLKQKLDSLKGKKTDDFEIL